MIYPAEMHKVMIGIHHRYAGTFLQAIHEAGIIELTPISEGEHLLHLVTPVEREEIRQAIAAAQSRTERAVEVLTDQNNGERGRIAAFFLPEKRDPVNVSEKTPQECLDAAAQSNPLIEDVLLKRTRLSAINEQLLRLGEEEQHLLLYATLSDTLPPPEEKQFLTIRAGLIPGGECEDVALLLWEEGIENAVAASVCRFQEEGMVALVVSHRTAADRVDSLLRSRAFADFQFGWRTGNVAGALRSVGQEREALKREREEINESLDTIRKQKYQQLFGLAEELRLAREQIDASARAGRTRDLRLYTGWIRRRDIPTLEKIGEDSAGGTLIYRSIPGTDGDADVPVSYAHPFWLRPFETLTSTFARPRYREVDPTIFLAPVLVITFGIMLGDAGYGLCLAILSLMLLAGPARAPGSTRDLGWVLLACSLSGIVFGILQGGFFGDLFPAYLGMAVPFARVDPLTNPLAILTAALIFGIAHLNVGLGIAGYMNLKDGKTGEMIKKQGLWFAIQPCAAILLFSFFGWAEFSQALILASGFGAAACAIMIIITEGPLGFFSITGFLGDWLSYTRILALALATAGIAMTVNILAGMIWSIHPVLVVVAIIFAIAGHAANLVLQALGGFIHALRLQYVEFFGTFYQGGGRAFSPFAADRVATRLLEDDT
ncbi:V-type ATP synthase subunit I [Methanocalculus natronophilus]|uniref:V-type ATP synthase subunit I n=1 Tax=Methanocalculus natronophilus TaxID=1262400 RepID=UPI0031B57943